MLYNVNIPCLVYILNIDLCISVNNWVDWMYIFMDMQYQHYMSNFFPYNLHREGVLAYFIHASPILWLPVLPSGKKESSCLLCQWGIRSPIPRVVTLSRWQSVQNSLVGLQWSRKLFRGYFPMFINLLPKRPRVCILTFANLLDL